jgi:tetratricopeptide (TPR) repeat protein
MKALRFPILLILLIAICFGCVKTLYDIRQQSPVLSIPSLSQMPYGFTEAVSLEFKSLTADYLLLNIITFLGEKIIKEEKTADSEWKIILKAFETVINLDPRATDPFVLANTTLPWEAGMVAETNTLLEKVAKYRPQDYRPYFFLWYNYYHFLKDLPKATEYLKKSAAIEGAPVYLKPLATRMHLYSGQLEASILYTKDVIETTNDEQMRQYMMKRLSGLRAIHNLEEGVRKFKEKYGSLPQYPEDLVVTKIIEKVPEDPYGGKFFITPEGKVYTTSKLVNMSANPEKNPGNDQ